METTIAGPVDEAGAQAGAIMRELPHWFGIPAAINRYVEEVSNFPTWLALDGEHVVGFLTIKRRTAVASELYCTCSASCRYDRARRMRGRGPATRRSVSCRAKRSLNNGVRKIPVRSS
jgi:hypothetical protein